MTNSIRAFYFLFHVGLGCVLAFLPTYLKTEGFTGTEISSVMSLGALCGLFGVPMLWGYISDRIGKPQLILRILAFGVFAGSLPLLFLKDYWLVFSTFFVYSFFSIGIMGILDSIASVRAKEQGLDFGKMRLFAPAGWFVGSVALGYYIELSGKSWNDLSVIIAFVLSFGLMFLSSLGLKKTTTENQERPTLSEIKELFQNKYLVLFYIMGLLNLASVSAYLVYYGPLIEHLGLKPSVVGLSIGVGTMAEVVFMFFFDKFKKWLGLDLLILISIALSITRWVVIANTSNPAVLIGIQVLHSEIALFTLACVTFITGNVPGKLVTTSQTIFYSLTYGVGQYLGIMLMGYLFDYFEQPSKLFLVAAVIQMVPLALVLYIFYVKRKANGFVLK
ncbi:MFS transporter [Flavobacteriaceae bacterium TP-CH-4]|uniref:MFS transporter n=1 Tax=Pelagihabitans pacificus TaxID=2696054 RepID=A0A967ARC8_9FLAO|nr:MFS transporter [Pelagihabitans pacificus]NHF58582.1 MFS transporter [Pelagihabitans pacificus]